MSPSRMIAGLDVMGKGGFLGKKAKVAVVTSGHQRRGPQMLWTEMDTW